MLALGLTSALWPAAALGVISPVTTIDGPSAEIAGSIHVAVSQDGSGGIVYLKRVGGRVHVFAARFAQNHWFAPQRVDAGQIYDSSWPAIGAGDNGRLVVVWAQPYAANVDRVYFSALDPGASSFGAPHVVDPNVGVAKYLFPSVAMNRGGQALMSYRVVYNDQGGGGLPSGYVQADIRLARYDGSWWGVSGAPLERDRNQPQSVPTAANSPRAGIGYDGQGLVAWQEPDDGFVNRIWARRIFPVTIGNVLEVSPTTLPGSSAALSGGADGLALHVTPYDAAVVAVHQQPPGNGAGFTRPRVYLNQIPDEFSPGGSAFEGPRVVDGGGRDGPSGALGPISVGSANDGSWDVGFGSGSASLDVTGSEAGPRAPARLDDGRSSAPGDPLAARAESGAGVFAWRIDGGLGVLERDVDGTPTEQPVFGATGGAVHGFDLAGSDLGDGVLGFLQGDGAYQTIDAATVNAPPGAFNVSVPPTWVRSRSLRLSWDPSLHGMTPVSYGVLLDDQDIADHLGGLSYNLRPSQIPDGIHTVQITATDPSNQVTGSPVGFVKIDRRAPRVRILRRRGTELVQVSDGPRGQVSGVAQGSTTVRWGDGRRSVGTGRLSHRYRRRGSFRILVTARDNVGNVARVKRSVRL